MSNFSNEYKIIFDNELIDTMNSLSQTLQRTRKALENMKAPTAGELMNELSNVCQMSLSGISQMYRFTAFNMRVINALSETIDNLPDKEEFNSLKREYQNAIKEIKEENEFIKWEKRLREDEIKDKEKVGDKS
jgi:hypothetical protein